MAKVRKVFFSFDYDRDCWRAAQIRNSWVTKGGMEVAGFIDAVEWEKVKRQTSEDIRRWINNQLEGTSVTVVLIGAKTSESQWVCYEIKQSCKKGNALLGIYIHQLKDQSGNTDRKGENPFRKIGCSDVPIYDWVADDGYEHFQEWIENAYVQNLLRKAVCGLIREAEKKKMELQKTLERLHSYRLEGRK